MKNKKKQSIAVLICFLGKLPWYFNYFIHSVKYNSTIDFYIITDDRNSPINPPLNVKMIYKDRRDINQLATQKLGFKTNIKDGYKMCDFKPAYGFLFSNIIEGYDFWGHADMDVIFGDIRHFITNNVLEKHELINVRHDFLAGYFLLFKNTRKMNTLFMQSKDYEKVLSSEVHYCFDETNFQYNDFTSILAYPKKKHEVESMTHLVKRLEKANQLKTYFELHSIEGVPGKLNWVDGKLYYRNQYEILLYHMIYLKNIYKPKRVPHEIPETFSISPTSIYHQKISH